MILIIGSDLFQWDLGRSVSYTPEDGKVINELHFANSGDAKALVMEAVAEDGTYTAEIPNILLQTGKEIRVWAVISAEENRSTVEQAVLPVRKREKPADYVYTQTEVKSYAALEARLEKLEEGGIGGGVTGEQVEDAVNKYLEENPVSPGATEEQAAQIESNTDRIKTLEEAGVYGGAWRLLKAFDLSSGATTYTVNTSGCTEVLLVTTSALTCSGQSIAWKGAGLADVSHTAVGSIKRMEYLGDGKIVVTGARGNTDTLVKSSVATGASESNNVFILTYSSASAGTVEIWGRSSGGTAIEDKITRPTTAEVGQTIVVKSVDSDGKPTEWEAVDLPGGDIVVAKFITQNPSVINCITHTEQDIRQCLEKGTPVIAHIEIANQDGSVAPVYTAQCWINEGGLLCVGGPFCDSGWNYSGNGNVFSEF